MTRELFWVMGNPGINCCVDNNGNASVSWKGKRGKGEGGPVVFIVFSAVYPYCSSEKKGCKGIKVAVNLTGLHSRFGAPGAPQMCPAQGQVLTCFLRAAFPPFICMSAEHSDV